MKEIKEIVKAYDAAQNQHKQSALATVVLVEGSAYRRAGARMLITEDGELTGAISGGCLEGDALRKARLAMAQQEPMLVTYDTMDDDDAKLGVGLGCNGIIHILIEPIHPDDNLNPIHLLKKTLEKRRQSVLVTLFSLADRKAPQPGTCLYYADDEHVSTIKDQTLYCAILPDAQDMLAKSTSLVKTYNGDITYTGFVELLKPVVSLIIFGAGNDALPLVQFSHILGWEVTVIDGRPAYAQTQRFPLAKRVLVAKPEQALSQITVDERTVLVLMTHNYNYEIALIRELSHLKLSYLGVLGPKKKINRMLTELEDEACAVPAHLKANLYSPVGLDIGSETSEEIALSIVAEIKAVLAKRNGHSLKYKPVSIHSGEHLTLSATT